MGTPDNGRLRVDLIYAWKLRSSAIEDGRLNPSHVNRKWDVGEVVLILGKYPVVIIGIGAYARAINHNSLAGICGTGAGDWVVGAVKRLSESAVLVGEFGRHSHALQQSWRRGAVYAVKVHDDVPSAGSGVARQHRINLSWREVIDWTGYGTAVDGHRYRYPVQCCLQSGRGTGLQTGRRGKRPSSIL